MSARAELEASEGKTWNAHVLVRQPDHQVEDEIRDLGRSDELQDGTGSVYGLRDKRGWQEEPAGLTAM